MKASGKGADLQREREAGRGRETERGWERETESGQKQLL